MINKTLTAFAIAALTLEPSSAAQQPAAVAEKPNIVFILADDLGYGDVSCYGQQKFSTPNIDKLAANGLRFTQAYAGSPVCSPSRGALHTGLHTGHSRVRGNWTFTGGIKKFGTRRVGLEPGDVTLGHIMRQAGYRTGLTGKWHLGGNSLDGAPWNHGYDEFYGWLVVTRDKHHPLHFPPYIYENQHLVPVAGNQKAPRTTYLEDLTTDYALTFIESNKDKPFMLVINSAAPHAGVDVPHTHDFDHQTDWTPYQRIYAQKVLNLDNVVGRVMAKLDELKLTNNTLVIFSSDNGPRSDPRPMLTETAEFFDSNGEQLRGYKRDVYEGGVRVPMIAHWPGRVPAGKTSEAIWSFVDILPTFAELGGAEVPERIDGISVVDALFNHETRYDDRMLYWEFYVREFLQAVRWGRWKAIRSGWNSSLQLYDLTRNVGEAPDVAKDHPEVVERIEAFLKTVRVESPYWPDERLRKL